MAPVKADVGACEFCPRVDVHIQSVRGDSMCDDCLAKEQAVKVVEKIVEDSHKVDASIVIKADIWNAATVSFHELDGAIQNNPGIEDEQKRFELVLEATRRIDAFTAAIFSKREELVALENERNAWLRNTQDTVAKLRVDQQAKFKKYTLNYNPQVPTTKSSTGTKKSTKPSEPKSSKPTYSHKVIVEICSKYGVDVMLVKMAMISNADQTPEQIAKDMAEKRAAVRAAVAAKKAGQ